MKFLANENFPLKSVVYLRMKGHDVVAIGTDYAQVDDQFVMSLAISENRTILTFDRDYGELIFRFGNKPPSGVIYFRLKFFEPEDPGKIIVSMIDEMRFIPDQCLTIVDEKGFRQRRY